MATANHYDVLRPIGIGNAQPSDFDGQEQQNTASVTQGSCSHNLHGQGCNALTSASGHLQTRATRKYAHQTTQSHPPTPYLPNDSNNASWLQLLTSDDPQRKEKVPVTPPRKTTQGQLRILAANIGGAPEALWISSVP